MNPVSMIGKKVRLERIMNRQTGKTVIIPMDHGVTVGPIPGLEDMPKIVNLVAEGGADAVLGHLGLPLYGHRGSHGMHGRDIGLIIHLSASTNLGPDVNQKTLVTDVEEAIKVGADAVSVHINVGAENEPEMLRDLGLVSKQCRHWGYPLLAMMYARGPKVTSEHDPEAIKLVARLGAELGADIVKTNYTGDPDTFGEVVRSCPVPVIIAGGPKVDGIKKLFMTVEEAMGAGAGGVAFGRNIFQSQDPMLLTKSLVKLVHDGYTADEVIRELFQDSAMSLD
jgi:fructose-bisphosphate aldolase/2-amino-3,7-dideoxy-D-threo-hept-6-ulosonate synthase